MDAWDFYGSYSISPSSLVSFCFYVHLKCTKFLRLFAQQFLLNWSSFIFSPLVSNSWAEEQTLCMQLSATSLPGVFFCRVKARELHSHVDPVLCFNHFSNLYLSKMISMLCHFPWGLLSLFLPSIHPCSDSLLDIPRKWLQPVKQIQFTGVWLEKQV